MFLPSAPSSIALIDTSSRPGLPVFTELEIHPGEAYFIKPCCRHGTTERRVAQRTLVGECATFHINLGGVYGLTGAIIFQGALRDPSFY